MIDEVVTYYKLFDKYKDEEDINIIHHLLPCYENNQYQILKDKDKIIGFINWAYLNNNIQNKFMENAIINRFEWNCGKNIWIINYLSFETKLFSKWLKHQAIKHFGLNQKLHWLRVKDNDIKAKSFITKEYWHG